MEEQNQQTNDTQEKYIDDCFVVQESRWKTWKSFDKDGNSLVTSLTKENCIAATRFYLKGKQEGFQEPIKKHEGVVGGKL